MVFLAELKNALILIGSFDPELMQIIGLSLKVSGLAVLIAGLFSVPLGTLLGLCPPRRVRWLTKIIYTLMGLPPVVAGLVIYLLLSSSGPFGVLELLWTPSAMVIAQTVLAIPIITGLTMMGIRQKGKEVLETAVTLGANQWQTAWTILVEARYAITGAFVTGFGRVVAEVGAVMMVGGNIEGYTRVMTTAIVLETRQGNFELAISLGIVLLFIAFVFNSLLHFLQEEKSQ
ncbi:MAG: ABC transporter permease [Bacillota bacterium]